MIVASMKSIMELKAIIADHKTVLFAGCGTCVTVCLAGGERETGIAAEAMRMAYRLDHDQIEISQVVVERQCDGEFLKDLEEPASKADAILSFGCGAGVQAIAGHFPKLPVYSALNTHFLGAHDEKDAWTEKCLGCGDCMLAQFGGICPVTRCAKRLLNGPCGGSLKDRCEISPEKPCAWQLIYERLKNIDQLDRLEEIVPPKDWSTAWYSGARKIVRSEHLP
jgi:ferredoxin